VKKTDCSPWVAEPGVTSNALSTAGDLVPEQSPPESFTPGPRRALPVHFAGSAFLGRVLARLVDMDAGGRGAGIRA
jgi:hypothetical protein